MFERMEQNWKETLKANIRQQLMTQLGSLSTLPEDYKCFNRILDREDFCLYLNLPVSPKILNVIEDSYKKDVEAKRLIFNYPTPLDQEQDEIHIAVWKLWTKFILFRLSEVQKEWSDLGVLLVDEAIHEDLRSFLRFLLLKRIFIERILVCKEAQRRKKLNLKDNEVLVKAKDQEQHKDEDEVLHVEEMHMLRKKRMRKMKTKIRIK